MKPEERHCGLRDVGHLLIGWRLMREFPLSPIYGVADSNCVRVHKVMLLFKLGMDRWFIVDGRIRYSITNI